MNMTKYMFRLGALLTCIICLSCGGGGGKDPVGPGHEEYIVSGNVVDANGVGVSGVTITFTAIGQMYTKTTASDGSFSISFIDQATFSVTATFGEYDITPASQQVVVDKNVSDVNFTLDSTIIRFEPESVDIPGVDQTNTVKIMIDNVSLLTGAAFTVQFDSTLIEVDSIETSGDGFMITDAGAQIIFPVVNIDEKGFASIAVGSKIQGDYTGADGSGMLAKITFNALQVGKSPLTFVNDGSKDFTISCNSGEGIPDYYTPLPYKGYISVLEDN